MHLKRILLIVTSVIWSAHAAAAGSGTGAQRGDVCAQLKSLYTRNLFTGDANNAIAQHFDAQKEPVLIAQCQAAQQAAATTWWKQKGRSEAQQGMLRNFLSGLVWTIAGLFSARHVCEASSSGTGKPFTKKTAAAILSAVSVRSVCQQLVQIKNRVHTLISESARKKHLFGHFHQRDLPELRKLSEFQPLNEQETLVKRLARLRESKRKLPAAA